MRRINPFLPTLAPSGVPRERVFQGGQGEIERMHYFPCQRRGKEKKIFSLSLSECKYIEEYCLVLPIPSYLVAGKLKPYSRRNARVPLLLLLLLLQFIPLFWSQLALDLLPFAVPSLQVDCELHKNLSSVPFPLGETKRRDTQCVVVVAAVRQYARLLSWRLREKRS